MTLLLLVAFFLQQLPLLHQISFPVKWSQCRDHSTTILSEMFSGPTTPSSCPQKQILAGDDDGIGSSSVWCDGTSYSNRLCRFENLCYHPEAGAWFFLHDRNSVLSGLPKNRFDPSLLDAGTAHHHNAHAFNFADVPLSAALHWNFQIEHKLTLMFWRFNPNNLMHAIHDDLLPAFHAIQRIFGRVRDRRFPVKLVFLDQAPLHGPYSELYEALSDEKPTTVSVLRLLNKVTCFRQIHVGISKHTTWYQYGFQEPQGPLPNSEVNSADIRTFCLYLKERLQIAPSHSRYAVLLSRQQNRRILNELQVSQTIARETEIMVVTCSTDTHTIRQVISLVSGASLVVAVHGSLLSLASFLAPGSAIVELFPYAINPDHFTPYRTLANLPGMNINYQAWRNWHRHLSVTFADRPWQTGGIAHLPAEEQQQIETSSQVPLHLCCRNPHWLFRIYQDTHVDVESLSATLRSVIRVKQPSKDMLTLTSKPAMSFLDGGNVDVDPSLQVLYPMQVQDLKCLSSSSVMHIKWSQPWNAVYLGVALRYELWLQPDKQETYSAWITSSLDHTVTSEIMTRRRYLIWVRAVLQDDTTGPFNGQHIMCSFAEHNS